MSYPNCYNVILLSTIHFVRTTLVTPMLQEYDETIFDNIYSYKHCFMITLVEKEKTTYHIFLVQISL